MLVLLALENYSGDRLWWEASYQSPEFCTRAIGSLFSRELVWLSKVTSQSEFSENLWDSREASAWKIFSLCLVHWGRSRGMREREDSALLCLCKIHPAGTGSGGRAVRPEFRTCKEFHHPLFLWPDVTKSRIYSSHLRPFEGCAPLSNIRNRTTFFFFLTLVLSLPGGRSGLSWRMVPEGLALSCV